MKRSPIERGAPLKRGKPLRRTAMKRRRRGVSPASPAQRSKVRDAVSIFSGQEPCDPAHLWPRSLGGCDHPDCVIPLTRSEHRDFDDGKLDILPALIERECFAEMAHMIEAHQLSPLTVLERLTGGEVVASVTWNGYGLSWWFCPQCQSARKVTGFQIQGGERISKVYATPCKRCGSEKEPFCTTDPWLYVEGAA